MTLCARDIMVRNVETIDPNAPVEDAIYKISNGVVRDTGYKTVSLMVVDGMQKKYRRLPVLDCDKLVGVVYLSDVYHHLLSRHTEARHVPSMAGACQ